jgi:hypothetical protein
MGDGMAAGHLMVQRARGGTCFHSTQLNSTQLTYATGVGQLRGRPLANLGTQVSIIDALYRTVPSTRRDLVDLLLVHGHVKHAGKA